MSGELLFFELIECDARDASTERQRRLKKRLSIRELFDPFVELEEMEFVKRYRLTKQLVKDLCVELAPRLKNPKKSTHLSVETKVLTTLSFYATGSYQKPIGDISAHSLAQQTVSSVIAEVTACIDSPEMRRKYIIFPKNFEERNKIRARLAILCPFYWSPTVVELQSVDDDDFIKSGSSKMVQKQQPGSLYFSRFYQKFKVPGVLGCIDCTHIAIVRPVDNEERYYCRKHYHSLNVQLICDADMQIISLDASYGGATHDSFIWNEHPLRSHLENLNEATWLLGDSGYPLRRFMMTPILNAVPNSPESHYTDVHVQTRNIIERTIGLLKGRFRCLLVHRVLHYKPKMAASITNACVILHNICNRANVPAVNLSDEDMHREVQMQESRSDANAGSISSNAQALRQGVAVRNDLIRRLEQSR